MRKNRLLIFAAPGEARPARWRREAHFSVKWRLGRSTWPSHLQFHPETINFIFFKCAPVAGQFPSTVLRRGGGA